MLSGYKTLILALLSAAAATIGWGIGTVPFPEWWIAMQGLAAMIFLRLGLNPEKEWLSGYKTYASQVLAMIGSAIAYFHGEMSFEALLTSLMAAFIAMFFRAGEKKTVNELGKLVFVFALIPALTFGGLTACASKYHMMYGVADWQQKNALSLQSRYDNADDEEKAFLEKNVNPYMNILKYSIIGMNAMDIQDDVKLSAQIEKILKVAVKVEYNPERLIQALRTKNYDILEIEVIILKNMILDRLKITRE